MSHSTDNPVSSPPSRPVRIAFVITELDPGGAERQLVQLVTRLDRKRFEPEVISLSGNGALARTLEEAGVPVMMLHARGRWDAGILFRLRRHLKKSRPDVVQTFLFHANIAGRIAARLAGVQVVVSGIRVAERRHRWHLWLDRWTDRLVDRHVCVSRDVADFSQRIGRLSAEKLIIIPNGVDVERFAVAEPAEMSEFGFPTGTRVILFVGRFDEQKDPLRLVEAFRQITNDFPNASLLFVGAGPLEAELRQRVADQDLGQRVVFAGVRSDVPRLMKASFCLALPSRWEGMPNVLLEAMAAGLPIVATAVEGVPELLRDGTLGTVVREPGTASLAAGLRGLLESPERAREGAENAQVFVRNEYAICDAVAAYERIYVKSLSEAVSR